MKTIRIALLCVAATIPGISAAQIPVTDATSVATQTANQIQTMAKWAAQAQQMKSQIESMKHQYSALTGSRNLGNIFDDPRLRQYLPSDWQNVYDNVRDQGYAGMSSDAQSIYDDSKIYDRCQGLVSGDRKLCEAGSAKSAQDMAFSKHALDRADDRMDQIDDLQNRINQTQDPKAIAELQARIASEQASIQNEQTRLNLYQQMAKAQDKMHRELVKQKNMQDVAATGTISDVNTNY